MEKNIFYILYELANVLLLITFIFSISRFKIRSFRIINFYLTVTLILLAIKEFMNFGLIKYNGLLMLVFGFSHLCCFAFFIMQQPIRFSNRMKYLFLVFIFLNFLVLFFDHSNNSWHSASSTNILLIAICATSYSNLFRRSIDIENVSKSSLLILNGVFLSTALCTPIILFSQYLESILTIEQFYLVACIGPISSIILYYFIFKALKCLKRIPI